MKTTKKAKKPTVKKIIKKTTSKTKAKKLVAKELTFSQSIVRFGRKKSIALTVLVCLLVFTSVMAVTSIVNLVADSSASDTAVLGSAVSSLTAPSNSKISLSKVKGAYKLMVYWETTVNNNGADYHEVYTYRIKENTTGRSTFVSSSGSLTNDKPGTYTKKLKRRFLKKYYAHTYEIKNFDKGYEYAVEIWARKGGSSAYSMANVTIPKNN